MLPRLLWVLAGMGIYTAIVVLTPGLPLWRHAVGTLLAILVMHAAVAAVELERRRR